MINEKRDPEIAVVEDKEVFLRCDYGDGEKEYRSPMQVIESLEYAGGEISYSNYDNFNIDIAKEIIFRWCEEKGIEIGKTREELLAEEKAASIAKFSKFEELIKEGKAIEAYEHLTGRKLVVEDETI